MNQEDGVKEIKRVAIKIMDLFEEEDLDFYTASAACQLITKLLKENYQVDPILILETEEAMKSKCEGGSCK